MYDMVQVSFSIYCYMNLQVWIFCFKNTENGLVQDWELLKSFTIQPVETHQMPSTGLIYRKYFSKPTTYTSFYIIVQVLVAGLLTGKVENHASVCLISLKANSSTLAQCSETLPVPPISCSSLFFNQKAVVQKAPDRNTCMTVENRLYCNLNYDWILPPKSTHLTPPKMLSPLIMRE